MSAKNSRYFIIIVFCVVVLFVLVGNLGGSSNTSHSPTYYEEYENAISCIEEMSNYLEDIASLADKYSWGSSYEDMQYILREDILQEAESALDCARDF